MARWIQNPPAVDQLTVMPNLHVTPDDASDIASYLITLR
jgi:cytochrome c1